MDGASHGWKVKRAGRFPAQRPWMVRIGAMDERHASGAPPCGFEAVARTHADTK